MRRPMMAGNWKMNKRIPEAVALAKEIKKNVAAIENVDRVLCPAFVSLPAVSDALAGSSIALGSQNVHWAESGAFTGEISAPMLRDLVAYAIVGHSERRQYFGETDESVNLRAKAAIAHGIVPIVCVGESLEQYEAGKTEAVVSRQVEAALEGIEGEAVATMVIAYEPIWAIGTGKAATADQANETCGTVRSVVATLFGEEVAQAVRMLYGGSTNDKNISGIMQKAEIDGALIGGSALKVDAYSKMVRITSELYG